MLGGHEVIRQAPGSARLKRRCGVGEDAGRRQIATLKSSASTPSCIEVREDAK